MKTIYKPINIFTKTTNFNVQQPHHDDNLQGVKPHEYVEMEDDGLVGILIIRFNLKK